MRNRQKPCCCTRVIDELDERWCTMRLNEPKMNKHIWWYNKWIIGGWEQEMWNFIGIHFLISNSYYKDNILNIWYLKGKKQN